MSFIGGKLKFKGEKKKLKKRSLNSLENHQKVEEEEEEEKEQKNEQNEQKNERIEEKIEEDLTESQRKHLKKKLKLENERMSKLIKITYRDRIEGYNNKLSSLTEHNDIPRVSAAGNG